MSADRRNPTDRSAHSATVVAGTPVLGYGGSDVVAWHIQRSCAGLLFDDQHELEQCLSFVADHPDHARQLASRGRDYVLSSYQWYEVLDRMEATLDEWLPLPGAEQRCAS